jgi:hypothetical protein
LPNPNCLVDKVGEPYPEADGKGSEADTELFTS